MSANASTYRPKELSDRLLAADAVAFASEQGLAMAAPMTYPKRPPEDGLPAIDRLLDRFLSTDLIHSDSTPGKS
jgi:hypothetical protein